MAMQGLRQLNRKMRAIPPAAKTAARKAVVEGAHRIAGLQKSLVKEVSGDLKESIHVTNPGEATPAYSQPGGKRIAREEEAIVTAGNSKVRYAHLVEFGTAPHTILGKRLSFFGRRKAMGKDGRFGTRVEHPGAQANPFFWPAYRALKKPVRSKITREINKAIKKAATS